VQLRPRQDAGAQRLASLADDGAKRSTAHGLGAINDGFQAALLVAAGLAAVAFVMAAWLSRPAQSSGK
jgi:hypothetical protein